MKILITGGAGFIGSNLVERLLVDNHEIVVIDDLSTGFISNLKLSNIEFHEISILDKNSVHKVGKRVDAIVHLAGLGSVPRSIKNPILTHEVNVNGTLNILELAREFSLYTIFSSSSSVYGSTKTTPRSENLATRPLSPYAASKLSAESYFLSYVNSYALNSLVFRFFNVFGPRQSSGHPYAAVLPNFIKAIHENRPIPLEGSGTQSRDFTYVSTVTEAIAQALSQKISLDSPVNLALGQSKSLLEIIEMLQNISSKKLKINKLPERIGDVHTSESDSTLFRKILPGIVAKDLNIALKDTFNWYAQNHK